MNNLYFFAYGTLRKDYPLAQKAAFADKMKFIGTGLVKALLVDLGAYPGAVPHDANPVTGDVFVLNNEAVLADLDAYEGAEYSRAKAAVMQALGKSEVCWLYWYNGSTEGFPQIRTNDYLQYLKTKKDRCV